jgi:hypothetical protein
MPNTKSKVVLAAVLNFAVYTFPLAMVLYSPQRGKR